MTGQLRDFLRLVRGDAASERLGERSDRELVEQFLTGRDEAAFDALLRRHGPMVFRVCFVTLRHAHDAEDAFQATFLLLARKAGTVRRLESLGSWLHGVAYRVSLKARGQQAARRRREASVGPVTPEVQRDERAAELHAQLERLPEKWRLPLILCHLEGRTHDEAAGHLGWSKTTLRRRLAEGREALARRLGALAEPSAPAAPPARLLVPITTAATKCAAGEAVPDGLLSAGAAALTEGISTPMTWTKTKLALALLALTAVCAGAGLAGGYLLEDKKDEAPKTKEKSKPSDKSDKADEAIKEVQGKWKVTGLEAEGRRAGADDVKGMSWTFKDNQITGTDLVAEGKMTFKLRADKKPKQIDVVVLDGPNKGQTMEGIYKLEKGVLKICLRDAAHQKKGRPTTFETEADTGLGVITLEKDKQ